MSATRKRPNIVLIISDQHNPHVMGCAGDAIVQTPNLDALARGGVRFTDINCSSPLCVPSRMGFMTGYYPSEIEVWSNGCQLSSDVPTFAHGLGEGGYEAILCGRMHFAGPDLFHGFERRLLGDVKGNHLSPEIHGTGRGRTSGQRKYAVQVAGYGKQGYAAYDAAVTRTAVDFLREERQDERPFCLVVGYVLPHNPLICSEEWFRYYFDRVPVPEPIPREYLEGLHPAMQRWRKRRGVDDLTPEQNHRGRVAYYGLTSELDANVGRVVEAVQASPDAENTVIIYCSDHGDMAGEHGMWWKSSFYNGSVQVPCIMSWPGQFESGRTVDAVASLIDVGPTVLDLAGCEPLPGISGRSLAPFLRSSKGRGPDWENRVISEFCGLEGCQPALMLRRGPWKMNYYHETQSYQLFNLAEDPNETNDLRDCRAWGALAAEMMEEIHSFWSGEQLLARMAANQRARQIIRNSGHAAIPHEIDQFEAAPEDNEFDFSQLPWWPVEDA